MEQEYKIYCKYCKKETIGVISRLSRTRGCKVQCNICLKESKGYKNVRLLKENIQIIKKEVIKDEK